MPQCTRCFRHDAKSFSVEIAPQVLVDMVLCKKCNFDINDVMNYIRFTTERGLQTVIPTTGHTETVVARVSEEARDISPGVRRASEQASKRHRASQTEEKASDRL